MSTAADATDKPEPAATVLPARFARWITQITQVYAVTATLPATHVWWNGKSTDDRAQDGVSSSPNVSLEADVSALIQAEKAALRLIARAEQCRKGLAGKLEKRGHDAACIAEVISVLSEKKLIDDRRYAQLWLESRLRFTRSPRRLLSSLCARGIERDTAESALKAVFDEEAELALLSRYVKKHSRKAGRKNSGADTKPLRFLLKSEGFSHRAIARFLDDE